MENQDRWQGSDQGRRQDNRRRDPEPLTIDASRLGLPVGPQTDVKQIADCLLKARAYSNVLAPAMQITHLPPDHVINFMVMLFPIDGIETYNSGSAEMAKDRQSNGIWYGIKGGKLGLHGSSLNMFEKASGISWVSNECRRTDDGSQPYHWAHSVTLEIKEIDGRTRKVTKSFDLDLGGDGDNMSPAARKAGAGLPQARINGAQLCESKAANRAIRAALGIRSYSVMEARRPFVLPVLQWVPNTNDPMIARMIAAKELGIIKDLFGAEAKAGRDLRVVESVPAARQLPDSSGDLPTDMDKLQEQVNRHKTREPVSRGRYADDHPSQEHFADDEPWDHDQGRR